jgi:hypothetical protein
MHAYTSILAPLIAPEIHADSSLLSTDENAANENVNNNNKKRKADFDPHCMLLGDVSVVLIVTRSNHSHLTPRSALSKHSPDTW